MYYIKFRKNKSPIISNIPIEGAVATSALPTRAAPHYWKEGENGSLQVMNEAEKMIIDAKLRPSIVRPDRLFSIKQYLTIAIISTAIALLVHFIL